MFNPGSPSYKKKVFLASIYLCVFVGFTTSMSDFGKQEHVLTGYQRYIIRTLDRYYKVTDAELDALKEKKKMEK